MPKKLSWGCCISAAVLIISFFCVSVSGADGGFNVISAYAEGNRLYTFIETDENMTDNYEASLIRINDKLSDKRAIVKNLDNADIQTRYIFLVDCSTSVRRYKKSIGDFIGSVAKNIDVDKANINAKKQ